MLLLFLKLTIKTVALYNTSLFLLFLIFFSLAAPAQKKIPDFIEVDFHVPWKKATITLSKGGIEIYTSSSDSSTVLVYQDLEPGSYKLSVKNEGAEEVRDGIQVKDGQMITVNIDMGGTCQYFYPAGYIPVCPAGNQERILEIRYLNEKQRIKGKAYRLVGYTATGCIPCYYCLEHRVRF